MLQSKTRLQTVAHGTSTDFTNPPDTRRQKNGMPPNFVHSLDSTHMMLTSLHCQRLVSCVATDKHTYQSK